MEEIADYLITMKNSIPYDRYISLFSDAEVLEDSSFIHWINDEVEIDLTSNKMQKVNKNKNCAFARKQRNRK